MSSASSSRRSFYPLPPSVYPQPLVDPCAAFETTYGHNHCAHTVRDDEFFRSRTLNPASSGRQLQTSASPSIANAAQGIYPRHGTGQFVLARYYRDSKGFRRPFEQPVHVDENYSSTKDVSGLVQSGYNWSHPSSRPTYAVSRAGTAAGAGATFSTSYRNSGLYDATSTHTSRVTRTVAQGLQLARSQQLAPSMAPNGGAYSSSRPQSQQAPEEFGYYTNDVRDAAPIGAEAYENGYESNLQEPAQSTQRQIVGDPLLKDPFENAYRKPRTVYKRSYGKCQ
jgi:hypothetical protein